MSALRTLVLTLIVLVGAYLLAWIGWYVSLVGANFEYMLPYFRHGWTDPGEKGAFIQLFAVGTTLLGAIPVWLLVRFRHKRKRVRRAVFCAVAASFGVVGLGAAWLYIDDVSSKSEWAILRKAAQEDRLSATAGSAVVVEVDGYHVLRVDAENGRDHVWIMLDAKHEPYVKSLPDLPYKIDIKDLAKIFPTTSFWVRTELTMHAKR